VFHGTSFVLLLLKKNVKKSPTIHDLDELKTIILRETIEEINQFGL
jgi:hypothetical protein